MPFEKGTEAWKLRKNFNQPNYTPEEFADEFYKYCEHCDETKEKTNYIWDGVVYGLPFKAVNI